MESLTTNDGLRLHLQRRARGVQPQDLDAAGIWQKQPGREAHEGRLAGAVGADQSGHCARPHAQADAVERRRSAAAAAKDLAQSVGDEDRVAGHHLPPGQGEAVDAGWS